MDKRPIFHKENRNLHQQDLMKNIWCPHYDDCLDEAATHNSLMDCSRCEHAGINYEERWRFHRIYELL